MFQKDKIKERGRRKAAMEGRVWSPVVLRLDGKDYFKWNVGKVKF